MADMPASYTTAQQSRGVWEAKPPQKYTVRDKVPRAPQIKAPADGGEAAIRWGNELSDAALGFGGIRLERQTSGAFALVIRLDAVDIPNQIGRFQPTDQPR